MNRTLRHAGGALCTAALILASCSKSEKAAESQPAAAPTQSVASAATAIAAAPAGAGRGVIRRLIGSEGCDAERAYVDCVAKACEGRFKEVYGPLVDSGQLAGPCKDYGMCTMLCTLDPDEISRAACGLDCADRHRPTGGECEKVMAKLSECASSAGCTEPGACQ